MTISKINRSIASFRQKQNMEVSKLINQFARTMNRRKDRICPFFSATVAQIAAITHFMSDIALIFNLFIFILIYFDAIGTLFISKANRKTAAQAVKAGHSHPQGLALTDVQRRCLIFAA